jgi:hypothetical protein
MLQTQDMRWLTLPETDEEVRPERNIRNNYRGLSFIKHCVQNWQDKFKSLQMHIFINVKWFQAMATDCLVLARFNS